MALRDPTPLLGGLSPATFMRRHWQKRPLLVRGALDTAALGWTADDVLALAGVDDVESRLVEQRAGGRWHLRHGPFARRALPPRGRPGWSLLVQGVDLHLDAAHRLLGRFAFLPAVRLDDLMVSYASEGGGVGPHVDSYDVFLIQVAGRRHWRIGADAHAHRLPLRDDVPLRMLAQFEPADAWVLEPGDLLYLPPGWAHDGVADGPGCVTASVGFRSPAAGELAAALLQRVADEVHDEATAVHDAAGSARGGRRAKTGARYADPRQGATDTPAAVPAALQRFAGSAVAAALADPRRIERALGEWLTEPKAQVVFEPPPPTPRRRASAAPGALGALGAAGECLQLDRRSRMAYDAAHVYLNGESYRAGGADARLMRRLADDRRLAPADLRRASAAARALLDEWHQAGWLHNLRSEPEAPDAPSP